jgi:hypothetical protein
MKKKLNILTVIACAILFAYQAKAQYKMVGGKVYTWNDPKWTDFNCYLEVVGVWGNDLICRPYIVTSSSQTVYNGSVNGRRASVVTTSSRVYQGEAFALRNYGLQAIGTSIYPGTRAMVDGTINVITANRSTGAIQETATSTHTYRLYDIGLNYIPPKKPLTPEERKAQDEKQFKQLQILAASGNSEAAYHLGECYLAGRCCEVDTNQALHWFMESYTAKGGNAKALKRYKELTQVN